MEVYFNELCLDDKMGIQYRDIERLKDLYYSLRTKGIKNCRISHTEYAEIIQRANTMPGSNPNVVNFLYAFLCQPYETEGLEERQEEYLLYSWSCGGMSCYGLALAYIMDSMSVSICDQVWNKPLINIEKDIELIDVRNLFDEHTFSFHLEWLEGLQPVELVRCECAPEKKTINLREDHGKDKLLAFSKRLVNSEYVCEVINSLSFRPSNRRFIHKICNDGIIELVLPWTDAGLGIAIKTTGRNKRETEKIAELLEKKYGSL